MPLNPTSEIQSGESSSKIVDQNGLSAVNAVTRSNPGINEQPLKDPLIYPDIYAPSGFDMLSILVRMTSPILLMPSFRNASVSPLRR